METDVSSQQPTLRDAARPIAVVIVSILFPPFAIIGGLGLGNIGLTWARSSRSSRRTLGVVFTVIAIGLLIYGILFLQGFFTETTFREGSPLG